MAPPTTAISIRLPVGLLEQIKIATNKRDVPYQSLIKSVAIGDGRITVTASASCISRDVG
ncbi:MAG TPA: CopG family antitoxin [Bradyrhizobium sp.]|nr:CopG family antitoxin [Bradyrhizobium sp.]HKO73016.1 CopG family antitoxin [Bradyrhizobium sp.]